MGKGEIARNEQFLLFPQCFLPFLAILIKFEIVVCILFQFGSLKIVVCERVKPLYTILLSKTLTNKGFESGVTSIFMFPYFTTMFSTQEKTEVIINTALLGPYHTIQTYHW